MNTPTKEETLTKIANEHSYNTWGELMYDTHECIQIEYTCEAMDEHAKSVAVRFAEWIKNRGRLIGNAWFFDSDEEGIYELNEEDLFDKFTEENK
jgi:hypothetical protein